MKNRGLILLLLGCLSLSGCAIMQKAQSTKSEPSSQSENADANGSSFAATAEKIKDACSLMPADLLQRIVPGGAAPQSEQFPRRCSVSNGKSVLEITIETGLITPTDPVKGAEYIPGFALGGYLERLDPVSRGDTYLTVILGKDPNGLLHVEVAGHDGKDHKDDAIAVAKDILAHLR